MKGEADWLRAEMGITAFRPGSAAPLAWPAVGMCLGQDSHYMRINLTSWEYFKDNNRCRVASFSCFGALCFKLFYTRIRGLLLKKREGLGTMILAASGVQKQQLKEKIPNVARWVRLKNPALFCHRE